MTKLTKNLIYNFLGQGLLTILGFVSVKFVFQKLGGETLGIIYFTLGINAILSGAMELGMNSTIVKEVAANFDEEPDYIHDIIKTVSSFYWGAYILISIGLYFGAEFIALNWVNIKTLDINTATHVIQTLGIAGLLALPKSLYQSLFRGIERMEFTNIIDVATTTTQQLGIIIILAFNGSIIIVVHWMATIYIFSLLAYILFAKKFFSWYAFLPGYKTDVVKRNIKYASNMMSISLSSLAFTQGDRLIASKLLPISPFGYYAFSSSIVSKMGAFSSAITGATFPHFSFLSKINDSDKMLSQYRKSHDLLSYGIVPFFAVIPFIILPVFSFVFNVQIARMLLLPITFLSLGSYMNGTISVPYIFSLSVNKPEISTKSNILALFIVLPVTFILIYFWGLNGAGFSWVFYHIFAYSYAVPRICKECLGIKARKWFSHIFKIFFLVFVTYGIAWIIISLNNAYNIKYLAIAYFTATLLFLVAAYQMIDSGLKFSILMFPLFSKLKLLKVKKIF